MWRVMYGLRYARSALFTGYPSPTSSPSPRLISTTFQKISVDANSPRYRTRFCCSWIVLLNHSLDAELQPFRQRVITFDAVRTSRQVAAEGNVGERSR